MRYLWVSLGLSLRTQLRSGRFWLALLLAVIAGCFVRAQIQPDAESAAVKVGVVVPAGGESFWESLSQRGGTLVEFIRTDEAAARTKVAASQWDCALLLPEDFAERLERSDFYGIITLLTGPGSAVYPLVRETVSAALLEQISGQIASDYLRSSGIAGEAALPPVRQVELEMETLSGRALSEVELAGESMSRIFHGTLAVALLVWTLFAAMDLGRWRQTPAARRMRPCLGGVLLILPRLFGAVLPAFLFGAAGIFAAAGLDGAGSVIALLPYLAALGALTLLLAAVRPLWTALPAAIPFAAASAFVLSPVFADITLFFPQLGPLCGWLPVTLYLQSCEGDGSAVVRLLILTAVFAAAAILAVTLQEKRLKSAK